MSFAIPWASPRFSPRARELVVEALDSTWVSHGPFVERFERELTARLGARHGITTSNGTTALQLALLGLGIGAGDEVIVPGFTFVAPGNMVLAVGATPVFADVDAATWCVDPASVERCIGPRTRAVIAVHVYGNVCDMDALRALTRARGLRLVEDVAEACLSCWRGRAAGTLSDVGCFSFQATKTISMGEGGFVCTDDDALHARMRQLRDHGMRPGRRYWHDVVGYNFRLTNLQAALGCAQLEELDAIVAARAHLRARYLARLEGQAGLTPQAFAPEVGAVLWAFGVRCDPRAFGRDRDGVMAALAERGIETRPGFYPFTAQPPYEAHRGAGTPVAEDVAAHVLTLPTSPHLTDAEVALVCDALLALRVGRAAR